MTTFIIRKLARVVVVLLIVSFATTFLLELTPGDPAFAYLGDAATPEAIAKVHKDLELDKPFYERYVDWLGQVVQFDFGRTYYPNIPENQRQPVVDQLLKTVPVTLELAFLGLLFALAMSIPLGIYAAFRQGGRFDRAVTTLTSFLVSTPTFVVAPILVQLLAVNLGVFPASGWVDLGENPLDNLWYAFLPAFAISLGPLPGFVAVLRADMVATLREDFILNARAKGLSSRVILFRHAFRPSSFTLLTSAGLSLGLLIGGAVIVEILFALPGLGLLIVNSITQKNLTTVQGAVTFIALGYVSINALIDVAYAYIDPRVRLSGVG